MLQAFCRRGLSPAIGRYQQHNLAMGGDPRATQVAGQCGQPRLDHLLRDFKQFEFVRTAIRGDLVNDGLNGVCTHNQCGGGTGGQAFQKLTGQQSCIIRLVGRNPVQAASA